MPNYNGLDATVRNTVLDCLFNNEDEFFGASATWNMRVMTTNGTPGSNGTEADSMFFASSLLRRPAITFTAASSGEVSNANVVDFVFNGVVDTEPSTADDGLTIVGIEVWQTETAARLFLQPLDVPRTVRGNQTLRFPVGTIRFVLG